MRLWRDIVIACLIVIVIAMISYSVDKRVGYKLINNTLVICGLTAEQLSAPVTSLYLITSQIFPIVNARLTGHWSVIAETPKGYFNISTSRYMSVYIYPAFKSNAFGFSTSKWESNLPILKKYKIKDIYSEKPVTVYDIASKALDFYSKGGTVTYSLTNNNCQQVAQFIITTFGSVDKDDPLMAYSKGLSLFGHAVNDALRGPKIMF